MAEQKRREQKKPYNYDDNVLLINQWQKLYFRTAEECVKSGNSQKVQERLKKQYEVLKTQMANLAEMAKGNSQVQSAYKLFGERIDQHYNAITMPKNIDKPHYGVSNYATVAGKTVKDAIKQTKDAAKPGWFASRRREGAKTDRTLKKIATEREIRNQKIDAFLANPAKSPLLLELPKASAFMEASLKGEAFDWNKAADYLVAQKPKLKTSIWEDFKDAVKFVGVGIVVALEAFAFSNGGGSNLASGLSGSGSSSSGSSEPSEKDLLRAKRHYVEETLAEINEGIRDNRGNANLKQAKLMLEHVQLRLEVREKLLTNLKGKTEYDPKHKNIREALRTHQLLSQQGYPPHIIERARKLVERETQKAIHPDWQPVKDVLFHFDVVEFWNQQDKEKEELSNLATYGAKTPMGLSDGLKTLMSAGFNEISKNGAKAEIKVDFENRKTFDAKQVEYLLSIESAPTEKLNALYAEANKAIELNEAKNSVYLVEIQKAILNVKEHRLNSTPEPLQHVLRSERRFGLSKSFVNEFKNQLKTFPKTENQIKHLQNLRAQIAEHQNKGYVKKSPEDQKMLKVIDRMLEKGINARKAALEEYEKLKSDSGMIVKENKDRSYSELAQMSKEQLNAMDHRVDQALKSPLGDAEKAELSELRGAIAQTQEVNLKAIPQELRDLSAEVKGKNKSYLKERLLIRDAKQLETLQSQITEQLEDKRIINSPSASKLLNDTSGQIEAIQKTAHNRYNAIMVESKNINMLSNDQLEKLHTDLRNLAEESLKPGSNVYALPRAAKQKIVEKAQEIESLVGDRRNAIPAEVKPFIGNSDYIKPQLYHKDYDQLVAIRNKAKAEAKIPHHFKEDKARLNKVAEAADEILKAEHEKVVSVMKQATGKNGIAATGDVHKMTTDHLKNTKDDELQIIYNKAQKIIEKGQISEQDQDALKDVQSAIVEIQKSRKNEEKQAFRGAAKEEKSGVTFDLKKLREKTHDELKAIKNHIRTAKQRAGYNPRRIDALNAINNRIVKMEADAKSQLDNAMEKVSNDKIAKLPTGNLQSLEGLLRALQKSANAKGSDLYCLSPLDKDEINRRLKAVQSEIQNRDRELKARSPALQDLLKTSIPIERNEKLRRKNRAELDAIIVEVKNEKAKPFITSAEKEKLTSIEQSANALIRAATLEYESTLNMGTGSKNPLAEGKAQQAAMAHITATMDQPKIDQFNAYLDATLKNNHLSPAQQNVLNDLKAASGEVDKIGEKRWAGVDPELKAQLININRENVLAQKDEKSLNALIDKIILAKAKPNIANNEESLKRLDKLEADINKELGSRAAKDSKDGAPAAKPVSPQDWSMQEEQAPTLVSISMASIFQEAERQPAGTETSLPHGGQIEHDASAAPYSGTRSSSGS